MFVTPAHAQTAGSPAAANGLIPAITSFAPIILIMVIFYFLLFRPQAQQAKRHREAVAAVKKGDTVVTGGGIVGKVTRVDEAEVEVEIAANTRIRVIKATLAEVRPLGSAKPAND
jgi:preprotein translocase subunit YajC